MNRNASQLFVLAIAAMAFGTAPELNAAILWDYSPSIYGSPFYNRVSYTTNLNYAESFSFNEPVQLTGIDIYGHSTNGRVGMSTTIRLWSDLAGKPQTLLSSFTENISVIDRDGAAVNNINNRKHVDFTVPLTLSANTTYWIGISAYTEGLSLASTDTRPPGGNGTAAVFSGTLYLTSSVGGDLAFRLHGEVVPEPSSLVILAGMAWAAIAFRKAKSLRS